MSLKGNISIVEYMFGLGDTLNKIILPNYFSELLG